MSEFNIDAKQISDSLKDTLGNWQDSVKDDLVGSVSAVADGVARVRGLENVMASELLEFPGGLVGVALKKQVIDSDIVLTFAQIPGKKAPVLIEKSTIANMRENSVIIDLAAGSGGNCEGTEVNKVVELNGVKIVGETDILNSVKHAATKLYSENVRNLIELYIENSDDEIFTEMSS